MLTAHAVNFAALREREFSRLDAHDEVYLDYTGAALHAASHIDAHHRLLDGDVLGNPHAAHAASERSAIIIDDARDATLRFFGVTRETHDVCFTANATAAVKLVAESFPFGTGRSLVLAADNHNSVNGLREYARRLQATVAYVPLDSLLRLAGAEAVLAGASTMGPGLFALPAQSNFSGVTHPLSLVASARASGWRVLLDAAAFAPTNPLDLSSVPADFTVVSFYKLFGYPTGIGALIARREALAELRRPWFSGGTVDFVSLQLDRHQLRGGAGGFEDGTPNYLGIAALPFGLEFLQRVGLDEIHEHVSAHTQRFVAHVSAMAHRNGTALVEIYGPGIAPDRGATVAFNIKDSEGRTVPYPLVEARARDAGIALRGGCFCNPGAAEAAFHFDPKRTAACLDTVGDAFTIERFASCLGDHATVGAVRVSFGVPTNARDVERAIQLIGSFALTN